jgi:hypothetical protein
MASLLNRKATFSNKQEKRAKILTTVFTNPQNWHTKIGWFCL